MKSTFTKVEAGTFYKRKNGEDENVYIVLETFTPVSSFIVTNIFVRFFPVTPKNEQLADSILPLNQFNEVYTDAMVSIEEKQMLDEIFHTKKVLAEIISKEIALKEKLHGMMHNFITKKSKFTKDYIANRQKHLHTPLTIEMASEEGEDIKIKYSLKKGKHVLGEDLAFIKQDCATGIFSIEENTQDFQKIHTETGGFTKNNQASIISMLESLVYANGYITKIENTLSIEIVKNKYLTMNCEIFVSIDQHAVREDVERELSTIETFLNSLQNIYV